MRYGMICFSNLKFEIIEIKLVHADESRRLFVFGFFFTKGWKENPSEKNFLLSRAKTKQWKHDSFLLRKIFLLSALITSDIFWQRKRAKLAGTHSRCFFLNQQCSYIQLFVIQHQLYQCCITYRLIISHSGHWKPNIDKISLLKTNSYQHSRTNKSEMVTEDMVMLCILLRLGQSLPCIQPNPYYHFHETGVSLIINNQFK